MRLHFLIVVLAMTACQTENELRHTATLQAETNGLALSDDGDDAFAAMSGTTCTVDANWGCPIDDADLPTGEEFVADHYKGVTLGISTRGLHRIERDGWDRAADVSMPNVRAAKLFDGGSVFLWGDSDACHVQRGDGAATLIPGAACLDGATVDVDRRDGTLFASTRDGLLEVGEDGARNITTGPDLAVWDPILRHFYVATTGQAILSAITRQGDEVWTTSTGGNITSIAVRGRLGEVAALSEGTDTMGIFERFDGETGKLLATSELPDADAEVVISPDGTTVATVRPEEVHFYALEIEVEPGDEQVDPEVEPPTCIAPTRTVRD